MFGGIAVNIVPWNSRGRLSGEFDVFNENLRPIGHIVQRKRGPTYIYIWSFSSSSKSRSQPVSCGSAIDEGGWRAIPFVNCTNAQ